MKRLHILSLAVTITLLVTAQIARAQRGEIQYFRPYDQRGLNVFETSKNDTVKFDGQFISNCRKADLCQKIKRAG